MPKKDDLIGQVFQTYRVIKKLPSKNGKVYWLCKCEICSKEKEIQGGHLKKGLFKKCECAKTKEDYQRSHRKSLLYSVSDESFKKLVKESSNIKEVLRKIGYTYEGGSLVKIFKDRCKELNIDYSHFNQYKNRGYTLRTEENVFCENSTASQQTLRDWYVKKAYTPYKCSICGINTWNNKKLTLRLDHINGNRKDNRLENLRWVCPNCDSQLDTYCGRNKFYKS